MTLARALPRAWRSKGLVLTVWMTSACGAPSGGGDAQAVARGAALFGSRGLSTSQANVYACSSCHDAAPAASASAPIKSGAALAGVTQRPSFWGAMENDLLAAVDDCRRSFMYDHTPLARDGAPAEALYAYLLSLEPGDASAVAFTVPSAIEDVPRGDGDAGRALFDRTCGTCHGHLHTGTGRIGTLAPVLPEDAVTSHAGYDGPTLRLIFIEKVRHGGFFGYGGVMPPLSPQVLSPAALGDVLEAFGVTGQVTP